MPFRKILPVISTLMQQRVYFITCVPYNLMMITGRVVTQPTSTAPGVNAIGIIDVVTPKCTFFNGGQLCRCSNKRDKKCDDKWRM
ncbi:hypothetical protein FHS57_005793 [Runella defluvii]|uniref:Uncharacterized protein n=1 Tax=Runella defluvii TaxID=370973 RepID=A0A7W5ZRF8_9BACT|nr:hypothetical protein [Runella defluvii]